MRIFLSYGHDDYVSLALRIKRDLEALAHDVWFDVERLKPVILTTQNEADVPFDLKSLRYIHYAYTPRGMQEFEARLTKTISSLIASL